MSKALAVYAGKSALAQIKQQGITQEQFKLLVGASGGPKWFVLAGLDRYFCGEFFKKRQTPLYTLGSSAGAWRFSCYAQQDPLAAINRLIDGYSNLSYPSDANISEVTLQSEQLLAHIVGGNAREIASNPIIKNTLIVAKSKGLTRYENKSVLLFGLLVSALANRVNRKFLGKYYQRIILSSDINQIPFDFNDGIDSKVVPLTEHNVLQALQATGSIPMVINGIKNIVGADSGMFRDGGIIDYHFDQPFLPKSSAGQDGLVLYPHFYNEFKPGWFDKYIKNRFANTQHFDKTLVLAPTDEFVAKLPYGKIPDRKDFTEMSEQQRIKYWQTVINESERLADEFSELCQSDEPTKNILLL
ncbi:patatin-like phospholipase family protein [Thalassotalea psychrophila]|uniref:Patatin-like phospholipase family protein n=1 Tax=Thalassotalea psychrophila TaxID=3065647 RepID=A0ABY9TYI1_9GAMM|nr:patatin-like phospholipase family protein [Colwelliaceae bacterium SQ149]